MQHYLELLVNQSFITYDLVTGSYYFKGCPFRLLDTDSPDTCDLVMGNKCRIWLSSSSIKVNLEYLYNKYIIPARV